MFYTEFVNLVSYAYAFPEYCIFGSLVYACCRINKISRLCLCRCRCSILWSVEKCSCNMVARILTTHSNIQTALQMTSADLPFYFQFISIRFNYCFTFSMFVQYCFSVLKKKLQSLPINLNINLFRKQTCVGIHTYYTNDPKF